MEAVQNHSGWLEMGAGTATVATVAAGAGGARFWEAEVCWLD